MPPPLDPPRGPPGTLSVLGLVPLVEVAAAHGFSAERFLAGSGVPVELLAEPTARVSSAQELALVRRLVALVPEPTLALRVGEAYRLAAFGLLGAAVGTSPTLREAIRLFLEYLHLTYTRFDVGIEPEGAHLRVCFTDRTDLGALRRFYLDRDLMFVVATIRTLLAEDARRAIVAVDFDSPAPPEARAYRARFACPVRFDRPSAGVILDPSHDLPRREGSALALGVIEEHLRTLRAPGQGDDLVEQLRVGITVALATDGQVPDIEAVAHQLGVTSRTLRRRLTERGTGYRELVDAVRRVAALRLLREPALSLEEVARRLGYAEPASFIRAHRRWTGQTPRGRR